MSTNHQPYVLGYASSHNGGACLLRGDTIVAAIQEERLLRQKRAYHLGSRASMSVQYCLEAAGIKCSDLDLIVFCCVGDNNDPLEDIGLNPTLRIAHNRIPIELVGHHRAHAIGAYAGSGFNSSAILVIDGCGSVISNLAGDEREAILPQQQSRLRGRPERDVFEIISIYQAQDTDIKPIEKHVSRVIGTRGWPLSLGHMYETISEKIFGLGLEGAGKVMGLAPYGTPAIPPEQFYELADGEFTFHDKNIDQFFAGRRAWPHDQEHHQLLAASVQHALEEAVLYLVGHAHRLSGLPDLCYAGGVALNSVANERIVREGPFQRVFVMPAAEDSGTAIGAAFHGLWALTRRKSRKNIRGDSVGRVYDDQSINRAIRDQQGLTVVKHNGVISKAVELLTHGAAIGWFQGRSELGPRALGHRSILCDPRRSDTKDRLNRKVKFRESFRPFAPAILLDEVSKWFHTDPGFCESPYMLRVLPVRQERQADIPAVVHVDGTGRVQTVSECDDALFHRLLLEFFTETGCPILLNTSLNVAGEPIAESPEDALRCLLLTDLDYCVVGDYILAKEATYSTLQSVPFVLPSVLSMDLIQHHEIGGNSNNYPGQQKGLIRSVHFDYFSIIDTITALGGGFPLSTLDSRSSSELALIPKATLARVTTLSPFGPVLHLLHPDLYELLLHVNGNTTCEELFQSAQTCTSGLFLDPPAFLRSISSLMRASIIGLKTTA